MTKITRIGNNCFCSQQDTITERSVGAFKLIFDHYKDSSDTKEELEEKTIYESLKGQYQDSPCISKLLASLQTNKIDPNTISIVKKEEGGYIVTYKVFDSPVYDEVTYQTYDYEDLDFCIEFDSQGNEVKRTVNTIY